MYQQLIRNYCHQSIDPRHVEAWMRAEHGTLDALSKGAFISEIVAAERLIIGNVDQSERLARSYGL